MATLHQQTFVRVGDFQAQIDEGIAPLIAEIWKAGIDTQNSCQENKPGVIWIEFVSVRDGVRFLNIVAPYEQDLQGIYNRARNGWRPIDENESPPFWSYDAHPADLALSEELDEEANVDIETHSGRPCFSFALSIRFPCCDYMTVLTRLKKHNERKCHVERLRYRRRANA